MRCRSAALRRPSIFAQGYSLSVIHYHDHLTQTAQLEINNQDFERHVRKPDFGNFNEKQNHFMGLGGKEDEVYLVESWCHPGLEAC